jgi:hypothetical protein
MNRMNENLLDTRVADSLMSAFAAGLASRSTRLQEQCAAALKGIGGRCLPSIRVLAASPEIRSAERARLLATAEQINELDLPRPKLEPLILPAFLGMLCGRNPRLRDLALAPLRCLGASATDLVIKQACLQREDRNLCTQLLRAAEQLEHRPTFVGWVWLMKIVSYSPRRISPLLQRLLTLWSPASVEKSK